MAIAKHSLMYFRDGVGGGMDGSEISKEVIEEQFAIILSRDYAHMLGNAKGALLVLFHCMSVPQTEYFGFP